MTELNNGISRRSFLSGTAIAGGALAAAGILGCSPSGAKESKSDDATETSTKTIEASETVDVDVVVVGGGMSGLAAAVQLGENGTKTAVLEKSTVTGGNGTGVEGIFAVDSSWQKERGIAIEPASVLDSEVVSSQRRANPLLWMDLIQKSGGNFDWLLEKGVEFSGVVDAYNAHGNPGKVETFHWFNGGTGATGYVGQMQAAAEDEGVTFYMETAGEQLIMEDGKIVGIYAKKKDGSYIQFNAKAVILATGGFADSDEYVEKLGFHMEHLLHVSMSAGDPTHDGDGFRMAMEAGAKDNREITCCLNGFYVDGLPFNANLSEMIDKTVSMNCLWVNEEADRYTSEYPMDVSPQAEVKPSLCQKASYIVFDQAFVDSWDREEFPDAIDQLNSSIKNCLSKNAYTSDSIRGLAEQIGLDADNFEKTVNRYNELCTSGKDSDFAKPAEFMKAITTAPYYILRQDHWVMACIGGIHTNRKFEVCTDKEESIPGLYAVGIDGVELYRNIYTIDIPGTANGNNINSGRCAANNATDYIKDK